MTLAIGLQSKMQILMRSLMEMRAECHQVNLRIRGDGSLSDSDSSDGRHGIEDTIDDEFELKLGNFGVYLNMPFPL
jgi:hypothetical protein